MCFFNQGIVIEFSDDSGLIKCTQNPQLYFHMSEVIEKKKLELNEKVEFSVVPVSPPLYPLRPFQVQSSDGWGAFTGGLGLKKEIFQKVSESPGNVLSDVIKVQPFSSICIEVFKNIKEIKQFFQLICLIGQQLCSLYVTAFSFSILMSILKNL